MGYCKMISEHCYNDAGYFKTPVKDRIWACFKDGQIVE